MDPLKPEEIAIDSLTVNGVVCPELISEAGNYNIRNIIAYLRDPVKSTELNRKTGKEKVKTLNVALPITQLRKYFDSFLKIYNNSSNEEEKKIQLLMLMANAEYSAKRINTERFKIFMANRIGLVVSKRDEEFNKNMKALKLHLEALVAYYPKN